MLSKEVKTIIFDVDGTLSEEVSWLKLTNGLGASADEHAQIFARMKAEQLTYPEAKELLIKLWQYTGNANKRYMENMFRSWDLKHDAVDTINYLKGSYRICLMSGAVDLYVAVVADKLGIEDWYANTELVWDDQGNLIDFHYHVDQAAKKLEHLHEYVKKNQLDIKKCAVVGDGDSDIAIFQVLPYGIAVNKEPFPELEALAYATINDLYELRNFF
jgi:HAD superfamily phosphoserine phosphatase-like hydrolase